MGANIINTINLGPTVFANKHPSTYTDDRADDDRVDDDCGKWQVKG